MSANILGGVFSGGGSEQTVLCRIPLRPGLGESDHLLVSRLVVVQSWSEIVGKMRRFCVDRWGGLARGNAGASFDQPFQLMGRGLSTSRECHCSMAVLRKTFQRLLGKIGFCDSRDFGLELFPAHSSRWSRCQFKSKEALALDANA